MTMTKIVDIFEISWDITEHKEKALLPKICRDTLAFLGPLLSHLKHDEHGGLRGKMFSRGGLLGK